jgi:hypothetical protein
LAPGLLLLLLSLPLLLLMTLRWLHPAVVIIILREQRGVLEAR